jgi:major intracellular serine protease
MILDTGVSLTPSLISSHVKETPSEDYLDYNGHGTHVAGIAISDTCNEVELISCKIHKPFQDPIELTVNCLKRAIKEKVDVINYSSSGPVPDPKEFQALKRVIKAGIKFVVAAGNNGLNLKLTPNYPASYKIPGIIVVGNLNDDGSVARTSNYGLNYMVWEKGQDVYSTLPNGLYGPMSGTSMSAAKRSNRILKGLCNETN